MGDVCDSYYPSDTATQRFWDGQVKKSQATIGVPEGFPQKLQSRLAWTGDEIHNRELEWRMELSVEDIAATEAAANAFDDEFGDLSQISRTTFKLPAELSDRLAQLSDNIYTRNGFQIISGLDSSRYSQRQNVVLYAGVSTHVCPQRGYVDVASKRPLGHVVNVHSKDNASRTMAPAFSDSPLTIARYCHFTTNPCLQKVVEQF